MDDKELLDIYTGYLISSFGLTTQTGLSRLLNDEISHDRIQRFLSKAPKTVTTQSNHFFASLCAYIKLEMLKVSTKTNHFDLKVKLYMNALRSAFHTLGTLQPIRLAA